MSSSQCTKTKIDPPAAALNTQTPCSIIYPQSQITFVFSFLSWGTDLVHAPLAAQKSCFLSYQWTSLSSPNLSVIVSDMVARRNLSIGLSDMVQLSALSGYLIKTWCERTLSEYCGWSKGCSYQCLFLCRIRMLGLRGGPACFRKIGDNHVFWTATFCLVSVRSGFD